MKKRITALLLISFAFIGLVCLVPQQQAYAHTFSDDESASFLALIEYINVELDLLQDNLESNSTLATEHAKHAAGYLDNHTIDEIGERNERLARDLPASLRELSELLSSNNDGVSNSTAREIDEKVEDIRDLLAETVSVRIEREQLGNSTVQALVLANVVDGVLGHYGAAYGIEAVEEGQERGSHDDHNMSNDDKNTAHDDQKVQTSEKGNNTIIISKVHYQSAYALAVRAEELLEDRLKELAPANATEITADLEAGLEHLIEAIDNREPFEDVEVIVHTEVHPNLQKAYNLRVVPEFPLPLLLTLPAIAGIITATRIGSRGSPPRQR